MMLLQKRLPKIGLQGSKFELIVSIILYNSLYTCIAKITNSIKKNDFDCFHLAKLGTFKLNLCNKLLKMFDRIIYIPLLIGPIFFIAGYWMAKNPPKKINHLYGYRSKRAMQSQEKWDFAQNYAARELMNLGFFLALTSFIGKFIEVDAMTNLIVGLVMVIFTVVLLYFKVEYAIKNKFND